MNSLYVVGTDTADAVVELVDQEVVLDVVDRVYDTIANMHVDEITEAVVLATAVSVFAASISLVNRDHFEQLVGQMLLLAREPTEVADA